MFINLWSAHMDPDVWPDPTTFKPERHLDNEGKLIKADHLVTFGLGWFSNFLLFKSHLLSVVAL